MRLSFLKNSLLIISLILITCTAIHYDQELKKFLFSDYDPNALPNNEVTNVGIMMNIYGIKDVDTLGSKAKITCSLRCSWTDSRLVWDPSEFGGIETTRMFTDPESNKDFIWTPDIEGYENANSQLVDGLRRGLAQVSSNGDVYFDLNGYILVNINMILADYPYDTQLINLTITSWAYTAKEIFLYP